MSDLPVLTSDFQQTITNQREVIGVLTAALEKISSDYLHNHSSKWCVILADAALAQAKELDE